MAEPYHTSGYLAKAASYSPSVPDPCGIGSGQYATNANKASCPPPERQGLTTAVAGIRDTASETLEIAKRLSRTLDPQYSEGPECGGIGNALQAQPHFGEHVDTAARRLLEANRLLDSLYAFVSR
jgi:hypothetical protein